MAKDVPPEIREQDRARVNGDRRCRFPRDDFPPSSYQKPQGFSITLGMRDSAEAQRIFQALTDGGTMRIPLPQTFRAERFGSFTDRFDIQWEVNGEKPQ